MSATSGSEEGRDPHFETYVIQFMMRPKYIYGQKADGGTTCMKLWKVIPELQKSTMWIADEKFSSVSMGDEACIFRFLDQDLESEQNYPHDPAKHTHKAERFIRYLLGQIHKYLTILEAIPDRPPRTFAVYLQWAPPVYDFVSELEKWEPLGLQHFRKVRQAINGAYFADGVRFRLVQDSPPIARDQLGRLHTSDNWGLTYEKFVQLVIGESERTGSPSPNLGEPRKNPWATETWNVRFVDGKFHLDRDRTIDRFRHPVTARNGKLEIEEERIGVVLLAEGNPTGSVKQLVTYSYQYLGASSDYCPKPHKLIPLGREDPVCAPLPANGHDETVKIAAREILNNSGVTRFLTNIADTSLFSNAEGLHIDTEFDPKLKTSPDGKYESIADQVCMHMSRQVQYGVILDAGSSGTRSYIYRWKRFWDAECKPILPTEMTSLGFQNGKKNGGIAKLWDGGLKGLEKRVERYLSGLIQSPLDKLLEEGVNGILDKDGNPREPKNPCGVHVSQIPLYVMATGGMRELRQRDGQGYIHLRNALGNYLNATGFLEPTYDTISGEAEGIFAWLDANFEQKTLIPDEKKKPHGLVEMGGQTVQLAFTRIPKAGGKNPWGEYRGPLTHIDLGPGVQYHVFSKTWGALGNQAMWTEHWTRILEGDTNGTGFEDPSVPDGGKYEVDYSMITGTGNFVETMKEIYEMFHCRDTACIAGDLCLARLKRGCLLNEIDGLKLELDKEMEDAFIGVSSVARAMENLGVDKIDVFRFFRAAKLRYSQSWSALLEDKFKDQIGKIYKNEIPADESMDKIVQDKEYLLREMFTAGLAVTMTLVGMGIPMGPYAVACVQLASIWFRVESQCLDAGVNPTPFLFQRLAAAVPIAFPRHFNATDKTKNGDWIDRLLRAILTGYFAGDRQHMYDNGVREAERVVKEAIDAREMGPVRVKQSMVGLPGRWRLRREEYTHGVRFVEAITTKVEDGMDPAKVEEVVDCLLKEFKETGHQTGDRLIKEIIAEEDQVMDQAVVDKVKEGLEWLTSEVTASSTYNEPYWNKDSQKIGNYAFRDLCFSFVARCLDWEKDAELGTSIIKGRPDASWTRGRMLLHSVGTTAKDRSFDGWGATFLK